MQSTDWQKVAQLHAANPNLKILMYSMAMSSESLDPAGLTTCTGYASDNASQPSWFLKDQNGNRIVSSGNSMMDMGDSGYEQACVAHAMALAKQYGFDGIMFDGLNSQWTWCVPSGTTVEKYPSTQSWEAAMQSFLNYAGATVHADHMLAMANLGGTSTSLWEQWTTPLDGAAEQGWTAAGYGPTQQLPWWKAKLDSVAWSEAHHKYAVLNSWSRTLAGNTYGLASMLLVAGGWSSYATNNNDMGAYEPWYPAYTTAQSLGAPLGAYTQLSNGVYERQFENGLVLVNASTNSVPSFGLDGSYSASVGSPVTSVSMGPTAGLIMLRTPTS